MQIDWASINQKCSWKDINAHVFVSTTESKLIIDNWYLLILIQSEVYINQISSWRADFDSASTAKRHDL